MKRFRLENKSITTAAANVPPSVDVTVPLYVFDTRRSVESFSKLRRIVHLDSISLHFVTPKTHAHVTRAVIPSTPLNATGEVGESEYSTIYRFDSKLLRYSVNSSKKERKPCPQFHPTGSSPRYPPPPSTLHYI